MKKNFFLVAIISMVLIISFSGCASFAKAQTETLDKSVPLEEQAQIIISNSLSVTSINGKSKFLGGGRFKDPVINIPAGKYTFGFIAEFSSYIVYDLQHTDTFEAGRLYYLLLQWDKLATGGKFWVVTSEEGYSEFKNIGPDETLVVLRRKSGDALLNAGEMGEINVVVNGKDTYRTFAGHTNSILLPKGEHKLKIKNDPLYDDVTITIDAKGGEKKYFLISRSNLMEISVKETNK